MYVDNWQNSTTEAQPTRWATTVIGGISSSAMRTDRKTAPHKTASKAIRPQARADMLCDVMALL